MVTDSIVVFDALAALLPLRRSLAADVAPARSRWCLQDFGLTLDEEQSQILFDKYDRDASGLVE